MKFMALSETSCLDAIKSYENEAIIVRSKDTPRFMQTSRINIMQRFLINSNFCAYLKP